VTDGRLDSVDFEARAEVHHENVEFVRFSTGSAANVAFYEQADF